MRQIYGKEKGNCSTKARNKRVEILTPNTIPLKFKIAAKVKTRVKLAINVTENVSGHPFYDTIRSVSWLWEPIREIPHNSPLETPEETPLSISPSFARLGVISHMSPRTCPNTQMFPGILENEAVFLFRRFFWKTGAALSPSPNMWTVVLYCPLKILCRPDRAYFLKFWKIEDCIILSFIFVRSSRLCL